MGLYDICCNLNHDRKGSSPSFLEKEQWEDSEKTPLLKLFVSEEQHTGLPQGCWGAKAWTNLSSNAWRCECCSVFSKPKHSKLHFSVKVIYQNRHVLTWWIYNELLHPSIQVPQHFRDVGTAPVQKMLPRTHCQWGELYDPADVRIKLALYHRYFFKVLKHISWDCIQSLSLNKHFISFLFLHFLFNLPFINISYCLMSFTLSQTGKY